MLFDGVNDEVNLGNSTDFDFPTSIDITFWVYLKDNSNAAIVAKGALSDTNYAIDTTGGTVRFFGYQAGVPVGILSGGPTIPNNTPAKIRCTFDGTTWTIYKNDVSETVLVDAATLSTNTNNLILGSRTTRDLDGTVWDISIGSVSAYTGNGNTDADWLDTVGSNNGTVVGSPALLRVPADSAAPTLDVYGDTLTNPAVANSHNDAETTWDVYNIGTGDVPCPESNSNSGLSAIAFDADLTADDSAYMHLSTSVLNDRLIAFSADLTGGDKTLAEKYTE
tara:strand:- start:133 stop:969 length:837 start_codon:yes stop_codon:yes gene_type:complete